ncbi:hypothetical protein ACERII_21165 [Evansella sp. AB-rgal1]
MKVNKNDDLFVKEALRGLTFGLLMMVIVFFIIHFGLGIKAFE